MSDVIGASAMTFFTIRNLRIAGKDARPAKQELSLTEPGQARSILVGAQTAVR
ncbi:MAG: hypothetical protein WDO73_09985 [Ignavibacteriota bacterium]